MAKAPLPFPLSFGELKGLSNAQLVQLVKQIESDHPQIKSLAHFMSKDNKLAYIGNLQYGTGAEIGHVIPAAETKYADFLAKAKAKNGATKVPTGTNCAATMQKGLEDIAVQVIQHELPKLTTLQGDITNFFLQHPNVMDEGDELIGSLQGFLSQLQAIDVQAINIDDIALKNALEETVKVTKKAVEQFTEVNASTLSKLAADVDNISPVWGQATDPVKSALDITSAKLKQQAAKLSGEHLDKTGFLDAYMEAPSLQTVKSWEAVLDGATKLDPAQLTPKALEGITSSIGAAVEKIPGAAGEMNVQSLLDTIEHLKQSPIYSSVSGDTKTAINGLSKALQQKAAKESWVIYKADFEALKNVDLKSLAYQELDAHGFQKSLGSFLTKDEKVELLAKFKADQPVDDLVASAKEKYLAKEAKAKGKVAGEVSDSSVLDDAAQVIKHEADQADEGFDVLAAIDGEEHLAPPEFPISIETEPHAPAKVTHVFSPTGQRPSAGSHQMEIFVDENGDKWLFKVQPKWQSEVEEFAAEIGQRLGIDVTEVRIAEGVDTSFYGKVDGSFQKMLANNGELGKEGGALGRLSEQQVRELQRQQVYDWLIANHDSHGENFLLGLDGHLIPIDKGQSMKFFGNDLLSPTYSPNASEPVYNKLWAKVIRGELRVDFDAIDEMLTRVEQLSSDEYRALLRSQLAEKYAVGGRKLNAYLPPEMRDFEKFVNAAVERKEQIRAQFETFYRDIAKRSGIEWQPKWAEVQQVAAKIEDPVLKLAVQGDVATPIDATLAQAISDTNAAGKALHLAGEEINQGQALVWQETGSGGAKVLRMELRLESQADARVTALFEDAAGTSIAEQPGAVVQSGDSAFDAIHGAAKTVNHHAVDGEYNQAKIDQMLKVNEELFKAIDAADLADAQLAAGEIDTEAWALFKAEGEKATHYKQVINDIQDGISFQHKVEHVQKFDLEKAKLDWLSKAPKAETKPQPTKVEAPKLFNNKPKLVSERRISTEAGQGYMERVRVAGSDQSPHVSSNYIPHGEVQMTTGKQFEGIINVEGSDVKVTWSSWNMTSSMPSKSKLTFELIEEWNGSEAGLNKLMTALQRLGVDSHLATREEERLAYWKITTGQMKHSVEYASPSQASGNYVGLRDTIERIEKRIAAEALDTQGQIAVYREEMAKQFGQDAIDRAPEVISHVHDLLGREVGYGHFERFDLPEDLRPYFAKNGKQWGISRRANTGRDVFENSSIAAGNGEKYRIGQAMQGASVSSDLGSGGSTGSFGSMGVTGWQSGGPVMVMNPSSVVRRAATYHHAGDGFGSTWARAERNYLNPSEWSRYIGTGINDSTREVVARHGFSFFDDMEFTLVGSESEKQALVQTFKNLGLDELRGLSIEDRVIVGANRDVARIMNTFYEQHPEAYTHSLANPTELKVGGTRAPKIEPQAVTPRLVAATPGSVHAESAAYDNALTYFDGTTNSTKAKLTMLSKELQANGIKKSIGQITDEFNAWWEATGQYKGLSQVKSVKSFIVQEASKTKAKAAIDGMTKLTDKVVELAKFPSVAKKPLIEELFGQSYAELLEEFKATGEPGGVLGSKFQSFLVEKAKVVDSGGKVQVSEMVFPKAGIKLTPQQANDVLHLWTGNKVNIEQALEQVGVTNINMQNLFVDFEKLQGKTKTFDQMLDDVLGPVGAKATTQELATVELPTLGSVPKASFDAIINDASMSVSGKVDEIAKLYGADFEDVQMALSAKTKEYAAQGLITEGPGQVSKTFELLSKGVVPKADFATVSVLGDINSEMLTGLKQLLIDAGDDLPIYVKDVANAIGFSQDTTQIVLDAAAKEIGAIGKGWEPVLKSWIDQAESAGVQAAKVEEKIVGAHPAFTAVSPPESSVVYGINTPLGHVTADFMNDLSDAAYAIEHNQLDVVSAVNLVGEKIGQGYGDMLPTLDAYAKDKLLGGFPGPNPADVLKAFVDDMSSAVTKLTSKVEHVEPILSNSTYTTATDLGKVVSAPADDVKIFSYNAYDGKVDVAFIKGSDGTNIIAKWPDTGEWKLIKASTKGKTEKNDILNALTNLGHPMAQPF